MQISQITTYKVINFTLTIKNTKLMIQKRIGAYLCFYSNDNTALVLVFHWLNYIVFGAKKYVFAIKA